MVKAFRPAFPPVSVKTKFDPDFKSLASRFVAKYSKTASGKFVIFTLSIFALPLSGISFQASAVSASEALLVAEFQQENSLSEMRRLLANLSVKLREVERELSLTTGRLEESEFRNREIEAELKLLRKEIQLLAASQSEMGARIDSRTGTIPTAPARTGGQGVNRAANQPNTPNQPNTNTGSRSVSGVDDPSTTITALPSGTPAEKFDYAFDFVRKNDLKGAEKILNIFAETYPQNPLTGNAYFWLGRIYLQTNRPQQAAEKLLLLIDGFADHDKRPDAFVDLAQALIGLDFKMEACDALYEFNLVGDKASGRLKSRAAQLTQEADCR